MTAFAFPAGTLPADLLQRVRLQIVTPCAEPLEGDGWLREIGTMALCAGDRRR